MVMKALRAGLVFFRAFGFNWKFDSSSPFVGDFFPSKAGFSLE